MLTTRFFHCAILLLPLLAPACGIVTAPLSVPGNIAANANYSLKGPITDPRGNPLSDVILSQRLQHQFWTPIQGYAVTDEAKSFQVNQKVEVNERGRSLNLTFSKTGYHTAEYSFQADQSELIFTPQGEWNATPNFPIVLYPDKPDAVLRTVRPTISYANYPDAVAINLAATAVASGPSFPQQSRGTPDEFAAGRPGLLYLTLTPETPKPINSQGELDPRDINLPAEITLHISGPNNGNVNGFIPILPKLGYAPLSISDTAPTTGYQPTLTIQRARLREMRAANMGLILEPHEYFYFRVGDHFGKGRIGWTRRVDEKTKELAPTEFYFVLFLQPKPNDTDLTTFNPQTRG